MAQLRPSTFASYRNNVNNHIVPRIGSIQLQRLQPEGLDTFYTQLLIDGKRNGAGGGLAPKTVRYIHGIIRRALHDAQRKGSVTRNVADLADAPKVRAGGAKQMMVWSAEELRDHLASIEHSDWYVPIFLAANTGMRRGEILGLPWRDVDLDTARLVVDQQILSVDYEASVADVKTSNSRRTIDLDPRTVAVLKAWRHDQLDRQMSTGVRNDGDFVFTRADGGPIHSDFFSQSWGQADARQRRPPHSAPRPAAHSRIDPLVHEGGWDLTMTPDRVATWCRPDGQQYWTGSVNDRRQTAMVG